jgi:hypothetical protein
MNSLHVLHNNNASTCTCMVYAGLFFKTARRTSPITRPLRIKAGKESEWLIASVCVNYRYFFDLVQLASEVFQ